MREPVTSALTIALVALVAVGIASAPVRAADFLLEAPAASLDVRAIQIEDGRTTAMLTAPSGERAFVAVGDYVGRPRALVVAINRDGVLVEERITIREGQELVDRIFIPLSGIVVEGGAPQ